MHLGKVFIAHSWSEIGLNIQTRNVAKKLAENGEVVFLTQARIGKPELYINDHLKILEWPNKRPNRLKDLFFLMKKIRQEKPQILIVHFGATNISMLAAWLMRVKHRICWMHTLSTQYYLDSGGKAVADRNFFLRKLAYRLATRIIVQNEYGRKDAKEQYNIKADKIYKIYNGITGTPLAHRLNVQLKSIRYSGRLDRSKGIDILLNAFSKFYEDHKDFKLEIAGKGTEEENLKELIKQYKLEEAVVIHGYLGNYSASIQFISEAYCLVVPSRIDNFPTVILEAMSNAVPVIASDTGGIPDMIEHNKDGLLVEPESAEALAGALKSLAENVELRDRMAVEARKSFAEKFSMDRHVNNVIEFLQMLTYND